VTIETDAAAGVVRDPIIKGCMLPVGNDHFIPAGGLICVDMYGDTFGKNGAIHHHVPDTLAMYGARLLIHATNGVRGVGDDPILADEIANSWHDAILKRMSFIYKIPIITVDNCYMMDGSEYNGLTSSESGVVVNGRWVTSVPRTGTQYFYHDFLIDEVAVHMPPAAE
jgi:hypothetical protein